MARVIFVSSVSACLELEGSAPYYAPQPFEVLLNGEAAGIFSTNVFSLYGLQPDTDYTVTVRAGEREESLHIRTRKEACALNVRDFGAVGDGVADDTAALQLAIHALPRDGRLVVPAGTYRTGSLFLKSHMTLHLQEGATLLGRTERSAYPVLPATASGRFYGTWEGQPKPMHAALITAVCAEDVMLVGPGAVDGNAQNSDWWVDVKKQPIGRPRLVHFSHCREMYLHGVKASNSASWQLHPYYSDCLGFYDVTVTAPKNSPNTDALDPESCDGVEIIGCTFSVGDDCIAIKSGKVEMARLACKPASRHTIRNCLMAFGHGAVVLGSEISGGVKELSVSQCLFRQTDRGLRIKTRRGRGDTCVIDGVEFSNIRMENVLTPIVINMYYRCDPDGDSEYVQTHEALPVDDRTPRLGRFAFRHMTCDDVEVAACYVDALPEQPVEEVTLEDIRFTYKPDAKPGVPAMLTNAEQRCKLGLYFDQVKKVRLNNVTLTGAEGENIIARHVGQVEA